MTRRIYKNETKMAELTIINGGGVIFKVIVVNFAE